VDAGGPKVIFEMEKGNGVDTSKVTISNTFTNKYALAANKLECYTPTTTPAGADG
jgi:NitT/TauT family transport system substrate-binding protein